MSEGPFDTIDNAPTEDGRGRQGQLLAGRYRIVRKLGEGGMGMVYLAEDTELGDHKVAIKFIPPMLAGNARVVKNLKREALTAMQLTHRNIVRLHDLHTDGHQKFLVMEYVEGKTLDDLLAEKEGERIPLDELLPIAEQIAAALDYAHSQKVLHRDLKPSNIMIGAEGTVKLLDFGIAREMKDSYTRVTGQETAGTMPYMSPEQLNGDAPNAAMDIYSLGATLYECLAGHAPFHSGDIKHQIMAKTPPEIGDLPGHVNRALQAALAKSAGQRPATAAGLVAMLKDRPANADRAPTPAKASQTAPDVQSATARIRTWIGNRKAEWTPDEWKDFVIGLYDDGSAAGLSNKKLEAVRDAEKKAWIKAEADRKAEEARLAEERRRAAEEAERKRREAEEARKRREEEQLCDEIKTRPTVSLCERYLRDYPTGRRRSEVEKVLGRLRGERQSQMRTVKIVGVLAAILVAAVLLGVSLLQRGGRDGSPPSGSGVDPTGSPATVARPQPGPPAVHTAVPSESRGAAPTAGQVITNSIGMKLVWISPGSVLMGSPDTEQERSSDEGPQHRVTLTKGFYLGAYEVTQRQWQAVMGSNPSRFKGDDLPVETVSWDEAVEFCRKLSVKEGVEYRLPTEAEWEYACRAGTTTPFCYGNELDASMANFDGNYPYGGGRKGEYRQTTVKVGSFRPNGWGLYDMHGNVWEWCQDWYGPYASGAVVDPLGPASGDHRVFRGGSWLSDVGSCRSAFRVRDSPGLRLARTTSSYP